MVLTLQERQTLELIDMLNDEQISEDLFFSLIESNDYDISLVESYVTSFQNIIYNQLTAEEISYLQYLSYEEDLSESISILSAYNLISADMLSEGFFSGLGRLSAGMGNKFTAKKQAFGRAMKAAGNAVRHPVQTTKSIGKSLGGAIRDSYRTTKAQVAVGGMMAGQALKSAYQSTKNTAGKMVNNFKSGYHDSLGRYHLGKSQVYNNAGRADEAAKAKLQAASHFSDKARINGQKNSSLSGRLVNNVQKTNQPVFDASVQSAKVNQQINKAANFLKQNGAKVKGINYQKTPLNTNALNDYHRHSTILKKQANNNTNNNVQPNSQPNKQPSPKPVIKPKQPANKPSTSPLLTNIASKYTNRPALSKNMPI